MVKGEKKAKSWSIAESTAYAAKPEAPAVQLSLAV